MARLSEYGIRLSSMSPSFLNSNSTSHTWPFSAVAELIDNASDPGVFARQIWIDVVNEGDQRCLTFTDNGNGMTPNKLHKMLSFGFTEKGSGKFSQQAIGVYGNGFKSGSMRLGRDALIFTKNGGCQTVGMLSQTYLHNIKAQAVIVPIVPFNQQTKLLVITEDSKASLAAILEHSIIKSEEQIHTHFDSIRSKKGTKILIWNIRKAKDGNTEIDFETDPTDFRLPEIQIEEITKGLKCGGLRPDQNIPDMFYSLRAYLSILYLKPRTQVILRGRKIRTNLVMNRLNHIEYDVYKPQFSKEKVKVIFGLNIKNKEHYGIMMYHKNRLIKAYEKVGCQLKVSGQRAGVGVTGIIECNFLKPAHNKQDFEYTKEYRLTLGALGFKLNDYWKEVVNKRMKEREYQAVDKNDSQDDDNKGPVWLQCEECLKWRSLPADHYDIVPESWNCSENPNPRFRSCSSPEEGDESDDQLTPSYYKKQKKLESKKHQAFSKTTSPDETPPRVLRRAADRGLKYYNTNDEVLEDQNAEGDVNNDAATQSETHAKDQTVERESVIKVKDAVSQAETSEEVQSLKEDVCNEKRDSPTEKEECEKEHGEGTSLKRKLDSTSEQTNKKQCLLVNPKINSGSTVEDLLPEKQTSAPKVDGSPAKSAGVPQQSPTGPCNTWTLSLIPTQTLVVSPLTRGHHPVQPVEGGEREAKLQRLAALEKETQRLRNVLGLEVAKKSQGTMTTDELTGSKVARSEVTCQTETPECSTSAAGPTLQLVSAQRAEPKENAMQIKPWKEKTGSQSRTRGSDSETCEDNRAAQGNLQDMRKNVVVLLTALLPQLDLTGISLETADVDNILHQIIEVNSLKL